MVVADSIGRFFNKSGATRTVVIILSKAFEEFEIMAFLANVHGLEFFGVIFSCYT